jgi:hypothetical protein
MLGWLKKKDHATPEMRDGLLAAVVVRNELVREVHVKSAGKQIFRLTAPLTPKGLRRVMAGERTTKAAAGKTFELDELGTFVWEGIDGARTVEGCIRRFAKEKRVNLREAEVAVLAFLKMLVKRGLVGMVVPPAAGDGRERIES